MAVVSGGTTLIDNGILDAAVPTGSLILLSTQTASASATISFTSGIDSTYDSYVFKFINIHAGTDSAHFQFNMSTDGGSTYNVTKTTTKFRAFNNEADNNNALQYDGDVDLAQSTSDCILFRLMSTGNDEQSSGELQLFNPSSTTFVKHFICTNNTMFSTANPHIMNVFIAGYGNTVSAVNSIIFRMSSGNIDDGIIKMYGVK